MDPPNLKWLLIGCMLLIPGRVATAGPEPAAETTDEYLDLATFQPTNYRHVTSK